MTFNESFPASSLPLRNVAYNPSIKQFIISSSTDIVTIDQFSRVISRTYPSSGANYAITNNDGTMLYYRDATTLRGMVVSSDIIFSVDLQGNYGTALNNIMYADDQYHGIIILTNIDSVYLFDAKNGRTLSSFVPGGGHTLGPRVAWTSQQRIIGTMSLSTDTFKAFCIDKSANAVWVRTLPGPAASPVVEESKGLVWFISSQYMTSVFLSNGSIASQWALPTTINPLAVAVSNSGPLVAYTIKGQTNIINAMDPYRKTTFAYAVADRCQCRYDCILPYS
jgi:hypothetical protein